MSAVAVEGRRPQGQARAATGAVFVDRADHADRVAWATAAVVSVAVFAFELTRFHRGWTGAYDLGVFDQAEWLLAHGHAHVSLLQRHILGDHLSLILLPIAGLYRLHATPLWLFAIQSIAIGAAVFPMRALARHEGAPTGLATFLTLASPALLAGAVYDFHASTIAVPFVGWLLLGARRGDVRLVTWAGVAALACRSDIAVLIGAVALVAEPSVRKRLLTLAGVGLVASALPPLFGAGTVWFFVYPNLGAGPVSLALHPWRLAQALLRPIALFVAAVWVAPSGWTLFRRPRWLAAYLIAAAPVLAMGKTSVITPLVQYGAPLVPLLVAGVLAAAASPASSPASSPKVGRRAKRWTVAVLLGFSPLSLFTISQLSVWHDAFSAGPLVTPAAAARSQLRSSDVVSTQFVSSISERPSVYLFPMPFKHVDPAGGSPSARAAARVTVVMVAPDRRAEAASYGFTNVVYADSRVVVARRGASGS